VTNASIGQHLPTVSWSAKFKALIRLTRWREHIPYTLPLVMGGAMLAVHRNQVDLDWRIIAIILANILAMSFAFMINDVADAPDDALNPRKKAHNVISSEILTPFEGNLASGITFLLSLILFTLGGIWPMIWGASMLVLSYLYSAHPFRLKARPVTDVVSHVLMLSALLVMSGYFIYDSTPGLAWFFVIGATLFSGYGQFYNQVDDYDVDKAAGLKNTVVLIGKTQTTFLMYSCAIGAGLSLGITIVAGIWPVSLLPVALIAIFITALFEWDTDMRGNPAEGSASLQKPGLFVANVIILLWAASHAGFLTLLG
jgi:4-hydroxybenzoate polyprenyltransferase